MFTTIDRYMLRQFFQVLIICLLSFVGLFIVIDVFGHLDHFSDYADKTDHNLFGVIAEYYSYRSLAIFDRTSGVLTLIAVMFTITWIQRHNEMTALLAAGISRIRVLRPVLLAGVCVSLFAAANREIVMPNIREHLATDSRNLGGDQALSMQSRFDTQTDILIGGERIVQASQKIVNANFVLPRPLAQYGRQLSAWQATYLPAKDDLPSGYLLSGVSTPKALLKSPTLLLDHKPVIYTPVGSDWLQPDQVFVVSGVSFEFLAAGATWRDFASTKEMIQQLRSPSTELGADVRVAIHSRFMQPCLDVTLLFLGLPFVVTRTNRNPFISIGMSLGVVSIFMIATLGSQQLGLKGLIEPTLAAWLPLMLFAPIAAAVSETLKQ